MAKEPKDRDEGRRPEVPDDGPGALKRKDAGRAKGEDTSFLPEDSFLLDVGDEAPRVKAAANEDAEEWILVDDDLLAAAGDDEAASTARALARPGNADADRPSDAARRLAELKDVNPDLAPVAAVDGERSASGGATIGDSESDAVSPLELDRVDELPVAAGTGADSAAGDASGAPVLQLEDAKRGKSAARPVRRSMSRAAGILVAASLAAAAWYGFKLYGSRETPTEVATRPIEKPVVRPKPADPVAPVTPAPKPEIESVRPPDPKPADPPVATTTPPVVPKPADPVAKPETMPTIPVIETHPVPDTHPDVTKGDPLPVGKPVATKKPETGSKTIVIDPRQPIRPARITPATAAAKSTGPTRKTDTIVELQNGYTLRGRIKRVKDDQITLGVQGGEYTFALAEVRVLEASAPEYQTEADMLAVSVVLKSGQRLRGKLMKQTPDSVMLVVPSGQIVLKRADVREVSFSGRIHF